MKKVGYVDGFVLVVPKGQAAKYTKMAKEAGELWLKHGALGFKECVGDDLDPDMGGYAYLPFPKMAKLKVGETLWYSYIEFSSKKHRDAVNKKVMKEMDAQQKDDPDHMKKMPFDIRRMSYGGFKVAVSL